MSVNIPILLAAWFAGLLPTNFQAGNVRVLKVPSVVILIVLDFPDAKPVVVNVVFADIEIVWSWSEPKSNWVVVTEGAITAKSEFKIEPVNDNLL